MSSTVFHTHSPISGILTAARNMLSQFIYFCMLYWLFLLFTSYIYDSLSTLLMYVCLVPYARTYICDMRPYTSPKCGTNLQMAVLLGILYDACIHFIRPRTYTFTHTPPPPLLAYSHTGTHTHVHFLTHTHTHIGARARTHARANTSLVG